MMLLDVFTPRDVLLTLTKDGQVKMWVVNEDGTISTAGFDDLKAAQEAR